MVTKAAVIGYLVRNKGREVCLAMHTKQQKWNGFGGKVGDKVEETIEEALVREGKEELGIGIKSYLKKGEVSFVTPHKSSQIVGHVFLCDSWDGEIKTNHEVSNPTWFKLNKIPWNEMWGNDKMWLEKLLSGSRYLKAKFVFDEKNKEIENLEEIIWE